MKKDNLTSKISILWYWKFDFMRANQSVHEPIFCTIVTIKNCIETGIIQSFYKVYEYETIK